MTRKELKVKYKNSVLGFAWSLLNPLLYLVVFYIAFVKILGSGVPAFPIFLLSGLLVWNLFSTGLSARVHVGRRQRRPGQEGLVPARDPAARRGRQHARALLPAEPRAVRRARCSSSGTSRGRTCRCCRWRCSRLLLLTGGARHPARARPTCTSATRSTSSSSRCSRGSGSRRSSTLHDDRPPARRLVQVRLDLLNPVTPIVLIFQRAIYARLDNPKIPVGQPGHQILPHWGMARYLGYLGYSFVFGLIVLAHRDRGVRPQRSELRRGALSVARARSRSGTSPSTSGSTTSTTRR